MDKFNFKIVFLERYPNNAKVLDYFKEATGRTCTFAALTKVNLNKFVRLLRERIAPSTARFYCAMVKAVMNEYSDEYNFPKDFKKILSLSEEKSQAVYLTIDEINRIIQYEPRTKWEAIVKDAFLLEALTGARKSDCERLDKRNIDGDFITYVSIKTRVEATIPINDEVRRIIKENRYATEITAPTYTFNIQRICRNCGITEPTRLYRKGRWEEKPKCEFVTSHTARRSFATNLYQHSKDMVLVSKMMGHKSPAMTEQRYVISSGELTPEVKNYFNHSYATQGKLF